MIEKKKIQCKSGRTYVRQKTFKMDSLNLELFFQKNRLLNKMISKNQVNRRNILTEKNVIKRSVKLSTQLL